MSQPAALGYLDEEHLVLAALSRPGPPHDLPEDFRRYLLTHGRFWPMGTTPRPEGVTLGRVGRCHENAERVARLKGWRYISGVALWRGEHYPERTLGHGWAIDERGLVVETTWTNLGGAYFGVELDPDLSREALREAILGGRPLSTHPGLVAV